MLARHAHLPPLRRFAVVPDLLRDLARSIGLALPLQLSELVVHLDLVVLELVANSGVDILNLVRDLLLQRLDVLLHLLELLLHLLLDVGGLLISVIVDLLLLLGEQLLQFIYLGVVVLFHFSNDLVSLVVLPVVVLASHPCISVKSKGEVPELVLDHLIILLKAETTTPNINR